MMTDERDARWYLDHLVEGIHTTVMATKGEDGYPHTCAVDMMMSDEDGVYFLTAMGKSLYRRLKADGRISVTGVKGDGTMGSVAISLVGDAEEVGPSRLEDPLDRNPYMLDIYPTAASRSALTVFRISRGSGEWFDLSRRPIERAGFSFGGARIAGGTYRIADACSGCGRCLDVCPQGSISRNGARFSIVQTSCLRCGNCMAACPCGAVRLEGE